MPDKEIIYAMETALEALREYYEDDAPVIVLLEHAIIREINREEK